MSAFQKSTLPEPEGWTVPFGLETDPFDLSLLFELNETLDDELHNAVLLAESKRFQNIMRLSCVAEKPGNLWLIKDSTVPNRYNLLLASHLFRSMVAMKVPQVLTAYSTIPVLYRDFFGMAFSFFTDRIQPDRLRRLVYLLLLEALGTSPLVLPEGSSLDADGIVAAALETEGESLDELFFAPLPEPPEAIEPADEPDPMPADEPDPEQEEDGEEAPQGDRQAEDAAREAATAAALMKAERAALREALAGYLKELADDAVAKVLVGSLRDGFQAAKLAFEGVSGNRERLRDILSLACHDFACTILFIDQMEGWLALDQMEQASIVGGINEFDFLRGADSFFVLLGKESTLREMPPLINFSEKEMRFELLRGSAELAPDAARQLVTMLIEGDLLRLREERTGMEPFSGEAVEAAVHGATGWNEFLGRCSRALKAAYEAGDDAVRPAHLD